jgi:hypothetical protein
MSTKRVSMRNIREMLRLAHEVKLSVRQVSEANHLFLGGDSELRGLRAGGGEILPGHMVPIVKQSEDGERKLVLRSWSFVLLREGYPAADVPAADDDVSCVLGAGSDAPASGALPLPALPTPTDKSIVGIFLVAVLFQ